MFILNKRSVHDCIMYMREMYQYPLGSWVLWPEVWPLARVFCATFLSESERQSAAVHLRPPQTEEAQYCSPGSCWWPSAGPAVHLPNMPLHGSAARDVWICPKIKLVSYSNIRQTLTDSLSYFIRHERGYGTTDLVIVDVGSGRAEEHKKKAHWNWHF